MLKSAEVDILADGSLDMPDAILAELDFTVCTIHYKFDLAETAQTERVIRATSISMSWPILGGFSVSAISIRSTSTGSYAPRKTADTSSSSIPTRRATISMTMSAAWQKTWA